MSNNNRQQPKRNGSNNEISEIDKVKARMRDLLLKTNFVTLVKSAMPPGFEGTTAAKIIWSAYGVIEKPDDEGKRKLLDCSDQSIKRAILQAASLGLEFGGPRPTCWMIPRGGEATYQTAAYGYITLAFRCGMKRISADVIYEADEFKIVRGGAPKLEHEITRSCHLPGRNIGIGAFEKEGYPIDKGGAGMPLIAYVVGWDADGNEHWGYVTEDECVSARNVSKAPNSPAHREWGDQMRIRTAISRSRKLWPDAYLINKALDVDENNALDAELEQALRDETAIDTEGFDPQKHAVANIVAKARQTDTSPKGLPDKSLSAAERLGSDQRVAENQLHENQDDDSDLPNPAG